MTEDLGPRTLGFAISTFVLAAIAIGARFVSRKVSKSKLWWDDWLALLGLVGCVAILVSIVIARNQGLGKHWTEVGIPGLGDFLKLLYIMELIYVVTLGFLKYSLLAFYWRTIESRKIRLPIYITAAMVTGWMIASVFTSIFQCTPVVAAWDIALRISGNAKCIDIQAFYLATAIPNIITDLFLLALPIPFIIHNFASTKKRAMNYGVFALGCFVAITSGLRLRVLSQLTDPFDVTWTFADPIIWSAVETNLGLVCICLPCLSWGRTDTRSRISSDHMEMKEEELGGAQ